MVRRELAREGEFQLRTLVLQGPKCQGQGHSVFGKSLQIKPKTS
jgi:hypothetical protein